MSPSRLPDDEALFADALARPEPERAAFLDGACRGDAVLACADNPTGRVEHRAALDEAATMLAGLTDEAKALRDVRDLIELIAAERGKTTD